MPKKERITGTDQNDTLSAIGDALSLVGGQGDDTYLVDSVDDTVEERNNGGIDTVVSLIDWMLGRFTENLHLSGDADLTGSGNHLDNELVGNAGHNLLYGFDGSDSLSGGEGDDSLDGGAGDDWISGDDGSDSILGGDGTDTAAFSGLMSDYFIEWDGATLWLTDTDDATDSLSGIEFLAFDDQVVSVEDLTQDPIHAENDSASTDEDQGITIAVLQNDLGQGLSIAAASNGGMGRVSVNADGTLTYLPDPNANGTDSFTYSIRDESGRIDQATVTIEISSVNDAVVAVGDYYQTSSGEQLSAASVLANDSDPDGDQLLVQSYDGVSAFGGNVGMNADGTFTYTPPDGFSGTDSFSYLADDGVGGTARATVTIDVAAPVNSAPVATADHYETGVGEALAPSISVLANDTDPDGDTLSVASYDAATEAGGTVSMNADGSFTYTPPSDFVGTDRFGYTVSDDSGASDSAFVTIDVSDPDATPYYIKELLFPDDAMRLNAGQELGTGVVVTYAFPDSMPAYYGDDPSFVAFSAEQMDAARGILSEIEAMTDLTFVEVGTAEEAVLTFGFKEIGNELAEAWYPYGGAQQGSVFSDIWFNSNNANMDFSEGSEMFATLVHEIGHAVGLSHPDLAPGENNTAYSVMEGVSHPDTDLLGDNTTFQTYDIAALQHLYGADTVSTAGDDVYLYEDVADRISTIWDGGGHDTLDMSAATEALRLDLGEGRFSTVASAGEDNLALAYGTIIEDAVGGDHSDIIVGNTADNLLVGGDGDDTLTGGEGVDIFGVATGNDRITDFQSGSDMIDLSSTGDDFSSLLIEQADGGLTIAHAGGVLMLDGVEHVAEEDFLFGI